ncbi:hypothetical protein JY651_15210 [Pyxidicoccus parkwayensis]|uniref:Uncharacterized protein n=1 Tax=Pyxidicoccus parkwayensis TaxID=2813578 RepID=A0ABX7P6T4_9BACT|nr:hypothetical protein [Pyxidicoccus parkwaysis]QSQ26195.1 hypothetical protein JY651_15210 [Pyxidicoccus parkwaysis]
MTREANTGDEADELVELAFRELHLSRNTWRIEVIVIPSWVGLKVRYRLGRIAERSARFTVKTSASERRETFLELVRSAVAELSVDAD